MVRCAALGSIAAAENDETGTTLITWPRHRQFGWAGIVRPVVSPRAAPALSASATAAALAASRACHRPRRRPCGEMEYMSGLLGINRIGNAAALRWNPGRMRSGLGQSRGLVAGCARRGAAGIGQAKESQSRQAESSRWRRDDLLFESAGPGPGEVVAVVAQATPLVGRNAEVSRLAAALAQAGEGAGSIVVIPGEAGIGKTRLCAEVRRWHRQRGGRVLLGRAAPQEASIPYAALADALRGARRAEPAVWEAARARAGILWAVAPELAPEAGRPGRSADRLVLFEALLDAVEEAAGDGTALWVLDDLHWADDSTWEFVQYAARRIADLALVLAVTYREEEIGPAHPWWPGLVQLKREPSVLSLPLARLCAADGERIVRTVDPALPDGTVAGIVERGAGTPLLVEELASLASRPGDLLAVPDIVRATVRERAGRLDPAGRALLEVAAVAGLEVDTGLLASILPEGRPGDLVSAGLLGREDEDRLRFRHPLLQEAAYQEVPAGRRRALHEQIAAVLSASNRVPAERIAVHLERADRPEAALSEFETAAELASRAGHVGRAATLHLGALQLARRHRLLAGRRAVLEEQAIEELFQVGRWSELDPLVRDAWPRRSTLPQAQRARLAAAFSADLLWTGSSDQALAVATDELASLEESGGLDHGAA